MSYRKKCKRKNINSENLHISLSKLIHKIKDKPKRKSKKVKSKPVFNEKPKKNAQVISQRITYPQNIQYDIGLQPEQFPIQNYTPMAQDYAISHYQVQTLEQQYQLNSEYRKQMACLSATKDTNLSYNDPYINPANFLQNPVNFVHDPYVPNKVADFTKNQLNFTLKQASQLKKNEKVFLDVPNASNFRIVRTKHRKDHENRVVELLKIQKRKMVGYPLDLREMEMLEKSTRTMWIGKLSEFVQERQIEFDASLYGHVMSVNIVREGDCGFIKCFGFIEFSDRKCIERFMKTSNHVLAGEKVSCRPGKVPSVIQTNSIAAGYVNKDTLIFTRSFELMLEIADRTVINSHEVKEETHKPKTIGEYFPLLPT